MTTSIVWTGANLAEILLHFPNAMLAGFGDLALPVQNGMAIIPKNTHLLRQGEQIVVVNEEQFQEDHYALIEFFWHCMPRPRVIWHAKTKFAPKVR